MKFTRREFLSTVSSLAIVSAVPAEARFPYGLLTSAALTQRNVVNLNFSSADDYPTILMNRFIAVGPKLNGVSPFDGFTRGPYMQNCDQNGYPNVQGATSGGAVGGTSTFPSTANFTGPHVITWDGDGQIAFSSNPGGTFSESNSFSAGAATFNNGSASIGFVNSFSAGQRVMFTTSSSLPTNFTPNTLYFVSGTGLSGSAFQVSATAGGTPIVAGSAGSGTQTVNPTYSRNSNGTWTNTAGQSAYVIFSVSGYSGTTSIGQGYTLSNIGTPANISTIAWSAGLVTVTMAANHNRPIGATLYLTLAGTSNAALNGTFLCTITGATTFTFALAGSGSATGGTMCAYITNVRIYRQADESRLLAGNHYRIAWLAPLAGLNPGALRCMNWNNANQSVDQLKFTDRNLPSYANWGGPNSGVNWGIGPAYGNTSGIMNYSLPAVTTGTPSNPNTTPSGTTNQLHGQAIQFQIGANGTLGGGSQISITGITQANPAVITSPNHGRFTGDSVWFTLTGMTQLNSSNSSIQSQSITVIDANTFSVPVNSTAFSAFVSGYFTMSPKVASISSISKASTAVVTTATNHNLTTGDVVIHQMTTGMVLLNNFPVAVTVTGATTYTIPVNTSAYPSFTSGSVYAYVTLQVGSQSAYPLSFNGAQPFTAFTNCPGFMAQGVYKSAVFDATLSLQTDGSGNNIFGVWLISQTTISVPNGLVVDVPIEACVQAVNELNAYAASQGNNKKTALWMCTPPGAINSYDVGQTPGTISSTCWGANMVDVCINPTSTVRSPGWSALTAGTPLITEASNEWWNINSGPNVYARERATARWGTSEVNDYTNMQMLRAVTQALDIATHFPGQVGNGKQVRRVLGIPPNSGSAVGSTPYQLWNGGSGTTFYDNDNIVTSNSLGFPSSYHEFMAVAPYIDNGSSYYSASATGTNTFSDDLALYAGTDNSGALSMTGGTGGVASTTLTITAVGAGTPVVNQPLVGSGITSPNTIITNVAGTSPNFTLTLSQAATVANGTTITSPANSGGNYIGAANQSQAIQNFVNSLIANSGSGPGIAYFETFITNVSGWLSAGEYIGGYEGGFNWNTAAGKSTNNGQTLTASGQAFMLAISNSVAFGTAWVNFLNFVAGLPNTTMSAIYTINSGSVSNQLWCYCADPWASGVEGQALLNNGAWAAMSARNALLS